MLDKSKFRFPVRRDLCVSLRNGGILYHPACFIEEREDGAIVLYGKAGEITYTRDQYRNWFLDDIQIEEPDE